MTILSATRVKGLCQKLLLVQENNDVATESNLRLYFNFKKDKRKSSEKRKGQEVTKGTKKDLEEIRNGAKQRY